MSATLSTSAPTSASASTSMTAETVPSEGTGGRGVFRGRIGCRDGSGFHAVPHRYRLHLVPSCPSSLRIAVTRRLMGLHATLPVTVLPPAPDAGHGYASLGGLYEATRHRYQGTLSAPVLSDGWTGRIVSNHAPDIVRDLAGRFERGAEAPELYPVERARGIGAFEELAEERPDEALVEAEDRLTAAGGDGAFLLGGALTAADVQLWAVVTVRRYGPRGAAGPRVTEHVARLGALPAFREAARGLAHLGD
ncbi:glutathione S-transferase family protein [Streptomyces sp. NPDC054796]